MGAGLNIKNVMENKHAFGEGEDNRAADAEIREDTRRMSKEEIRERLHFYHSTSKKKWGLMQRAGSVLSAEELLRRGLVKPEETDDFEMTSTGELDRGIGSPAFIFLSPVMENYGDVVLEFGPEILDIPGAKINLAGDYLDFVGDPELEEYFKRSEIPASHYLDHLETYINHLPNPEWFFGKQDEAFEHFRRAALLEKAHEGKTEKFKLLKSLYPEIEIPNELPLANVRNVKIFNE